MGHPAISLHVSSKMTWLRKGFVRSGHDGGIVSSLEIAQESRMCASRPWWVRLRGAANGGAGGNEVSPHGDAARGRTRGSAGSRKTCRNWQCSYPHHGQQRGAKVV